MSEKSITLTMVTSSPAIWRIGSAFFFNKVSALPLKGNNHILLECVALEKAHWYVQSTYLFQTACINWYVTSLYFTGNNFDFSFWNM